MKNLNIRLYAIIVIISALFLIGCSNKTRISTKQKLKDNSEIGITEKSNIEIDLKSKSNTDIKTEHKTDVIESSTDSNKSITIIETDFNTVIDNNGNPIAIPSKQKTRTETWNTNRKKRTDNSLSNTTSEEKTTTDISIEGNTKKKLNQKNDVLAISKTDSTNKAPSSNSVKNTFMSYFVLIVGGAISLFFIFLYLKQKSNERG